MNNLTPVTIFGGYLGSGKTTLILNTLKHLKNTKIAMIKNEYGDVQVDAALFKNKNIAVKEVVNGCLCCILVGELNKGVNELIETQKPDRIIIEASGNALPFPIVLELKKNHQVYVDGVVVVVDAENFTKIKDKSFVAREAAKSTDLIVINKVGMVDDDQLYRVREEVNDLNPDTVKIETSDGDLNPSIVFGIHKENYLGEEKSDHENHHDHSGEIETFVFKTNKVLKVDKVGEVVKACRPNSFYRIKGIVKTEKGLMLLNSVFGRLEWRQLEKMKPEESRIVFMGNKIKQWEAEVIKYLNEAI